MELSALQVLISIYMKQIFQENIIVIAELASELVLYVYSGKVGPLEPSCSLKDQLCLAYLLKESHFRSLQEMWGKFGPLKSNLAPMDQLCLNARVMVLMQREKRRDSTIHIYILMIHWIFSYLIQHPYFSIKRMINLKLINFLFEQNLLLCYFSLKLR